MTGDQTRAEEPRLSDEDIREIIRIAEAREKLIDDMRVAYIAGDTLEVLRLVPLVCGLPREKAH
jgi:hypothetical protein